MKLSAETSRTPGMLNREPVRVRGGLREEESARGRQSSKFRVEDIPRAVRLCTFDDHTSGSGFPQACKTIASTMVRTYLGSGERTGQIGPVLSHSIEFGYV